MKHIFGSNYKTKHLKIITRGSRTEGMVAKHLMPLPLSRNAQGIKDVKFFSLTPTFLRFEPFKMVITSYLGRQVDPMLEVHTEQKVEFPLTEDFFITG
jgi:hypothetical protein